MTIIVKLKYVILLFVYNYIIFCYILLVVPIRKEEKMDTEKHLDNAVLIYLLILLIFVIFNVLTNGNILDLIYLVIVVCCVFKYFIISYSSKDSD